LGLLLLCGLAEAAEQCVMVSGLPFCSMVKYETSIDKDPLEQDKLVLKLYENGRQQQLQTGDCLRGWKGYLCSFYFPKCPYCLDINGICRRGCLSLVARCAHSVQDFMATCYGGDLFVSDSSGSSQCTPYSLPNGGSNSPDYYQCMEVPSDRAPFCRPTWSVASAPHNHTEVWERIDSVAEFRWGTFTKNTGVSEPCKESLRRYFCSEYFAPCDGSDLLDPLEVLKPQCTRLYQDCPANMAAKVCNFNPYMPPDPSTCRKNAINTNQ